jgi:MFS family permease
MTVSRFLPFRMWRRVFSLDGYRRFGNTCCLHFVFYKHDNFLLNYSTFLSNYMTSLPIRHWSWYLLKGISSHVPTCVSASVYAIASPVGCLLGGLAMDIWGRRNINMIGNVGMVVGWLLITFAENAAMLICGRIVEGFSRSILATCITVRDTLLPKRYVCSILKALHSISHR